jgi:hypothetical protein
MPLRLGSVSQRLTPTKNSQTWAYITGGGLILSHFSKTFIRQVVLPAGKRICPFMPYNRRTKSGQITCYLNRTYHVLTTTLKKYLDRSPFSIYIDVFHGHLGASRDLLSHLRLRKPKPRKSSIFGVQSRIYSK